MMKTPFTLDSWLKDKSQKVETRDGRSVRIIYTDADGSSPIIGLIYSSDGEEMPIQCHIDGKFSESEDIETNYDLFLVTPEPELTEWEEAVREEIRKHHLVKVTVEGLKESAKGLLAIATKDYIHKSEVDAMLEKAYKNQDDVVFRHGFERGKESAQKDIARVLQTEYEKGKADAYRDIPIWEKADKLISSLVKHFAIREGQEVKFVSEVKPGQYFIDLYDLYKLPWRQ